MGLSPFISESDSQFAARHAYGVSVSQIDWPTYHALVGLGAKTPVLDARVVYDQDGYTVTELWL